MAPDGGSALLLVDRIDERRRCTSVSFARLNHEKELNDV